MSPWWEWAPRPTAAQRRHEAAAGKAKLARQGKQLTPVEMIRGHAIATTFWGRSWCANLEQYSDYANRLPRGRSYVRNGSVIHLALSAGRIDALVQGSSLYEVAIAVSAVSRAHWTAICRDSAGAIDSLVELLRGSFSQSTMQRLCRQDGGLFPRPRDITFSCSCPDVATMCKHIAAVLYGVGARLDTEPALLFRLRKVDENDLVARAGEAAASSRKKPAKGRTLAGADLAALFGLEMAEPIKNVGARKKAPARAKTRAGTGAKKSAGKGKSVDPKPRKGGKRE